MSWFHRHEVGRRADVARIVVTVVFGVLVLAFFRVQVLASSHYRLESEENRLRPVRLVAPRGLITDRNGVVLADNIPGYTIAVTGRSTDAVRATLEAISAVAGLDSARIDGIVRRYRRRPHEPAIVRRDASFEMVSALEERRIISPGIVIQSEPRRWYPFGEILAHIVGYVGEISEDELGDPDAYPGARSGDVVGRDGLELQYDAELRGTGGLRYIEVDARGHTVREVADGSTLPPKQGDTIATSLDIELQTFVAEEFPKGWRGALVAADPRTGGILALYSSPTFDPNLFVGGMDLADWDAIRLAEGQPLFNRAIEGLYPPASPWKLAVAASALKRGLVDLDTKMEIPCTGGMLYGNRYFRCWHEAGHGSLTLRQAIEHSCDVYFYQLGLLVGLDNLLADGVSMGFLDRSGIDLPDERAPVFPASTAYYDQRYGPRGWTSGVTLNLSIGQGENAQSVANMVRFYAKLANEDGGAPELRLVVRGDTPRRHLGIDRAALEGLRESLVQVVETGTAAAANVADLQIAGKTGTAQNPQGLDHGWFAGFAPAEAPEIVVAAIIEHVEHGSTVAPLVNRVIAWYLLGAGTRLPRFILPSDSAPESRPLLPEPVTEQRSQEETEGRGTPR
jgi:penicillin-binding protein 2